MSSPPLHAWTQRSVYFKLYVLLSPDELNGSGVLDFNVYATLQTSTSDLQQDPAFETGFHENSDLPVLDNPSPARPTPPPPLPPTYPKLSVPADRESIVDVPLLADAEATGPADDPPWKTFSDLEFPRDALDPIDTLGNSSFGEVRVKTLTA